MNESTRAIPSVQNLVTTTCHGRCKAMRCDAFVHLRGQSTIPLYIVASFIILNELFQIEKKECRRYAIVLPSLIIGMEWTKTGINQLNRLTDSPSRELTKSHSWEECQFLARNEGMWKSKNFLCRIHSRTFPPQLHVQCRSMVCSCLVQCGAFLPLSHTTRRRCSCSFLLFLVEWQLHIIPCCSKWIETKRNASNTPKRFLFLGN